MGRLARFASLFTVVLALFASGLPAVAHAEVGCPDILVLGSRGSGESLEGNEGLGPTVVEFWRELRQRVPQDKTVELWSNPYRARAVVGGFKALITGIEAFATRANFGIYARSIKEGRQNLADELVNRTVACANTRFVLAGYSQGGHVAADVYRQMSPSVAARVIGVALFGDPTFNSESQSADGNFELGRNGLLGKRDEFRVPGQVLSYCHWKDPVCQGFLDHSRAGRPAFSFDNAQHTNYMSVGDAPGLPTYPLQAARTIANRIRPAPVSSGPTAVITKVDGAVAGEPFKISAGASYDAEDRPLRYDWDLDNDGTFEVNSPGPIVTAVYHQTGTRTFGLRVTNDAGQSRSTTSTVPVVSPDEFSKPPKKPVGLTVTQAPDQLSATLSWGPSPDGPPTEGYDVLTPEGDLYWVLDHGGSGSIKVPLQDLPISLKVQAHNRAGVGEASDPVAVTVAGPGKPAGDLNELWNNYGDQGGHWTGGDRTTSVPLPDGRTAWLFSDTFLGTVNADHSRPTNTPMVHNTLVVQNADGSLGATLPAAPKSLVESDNPAQLYWVGDGVVEGGALQVLYNRYEVTGGGGLDVRPKGTALATFSLPGLTLTGLRTLPLSDDVAWGSEILVDGGYTYVYGAAHNGDQAKGLRIARVQGLGGTWEFWNGTGWSATETDAAHVLTGVGTAFSVTKIGAEYALVTMDGNTLFSSTVVGYRAEAPTGPFEQPRTLYQAPAASPGKPIIYYDATVHPQYGSGGRIMLSYNVNSLNPDDNYADARIYRPRFVSVDWQPSVPPEDDTPPAPKNLAARDNGDGNVTLTWDPVEGSGYVYRVYQRDVTLESDFTRVSAAYATPTATLGFLRDGHDYEFRVTAETTGGEGPPSNVAALSLHVGKPEPPTGLTANADNRGTIRLHWVRSGSAGLITYRVLRRDVTAQEIEFRPVNFPDPGSVSLTDPGLEHQHVYEYEVTAWRSGQESDPTPPVSATANYAKPATPFGLTATARPDGQIDLVWQPPEDNAWYWLYQRDLTEGEQEYTKLIYPITTCCTFTAGYLKHDHEYEFVVSAINRGGEGDRSDSARARAKYPPVLPPSGLTAQPGDGQVTLRWTASPTPNVWYWVYQRDVTAGETEATRLPYPLTTCCELAAGYLANTHVYEFSVSATGAGGESVATGPVRATPMPPLPAAPANLTAAAQSDGTIKLDWQETTPDTWFTIYQRDVTAGQGFTKLLYPVTTCCTFTAGLLTHNHVYEFKVAAINAAGESGHSNVARATAHFAPPPAPKNLRGRSGGDGSVDLDWDAPAPSLYYWIYWRDATNGEAFQKSVYPTDKTEWRLTALRHGHVYEFKVTAENPGGEGPPSATIQVTSVGGLPAAPSNLTAAAGDGRATLTWSASGTPNVWYLVWMRDATAGQSWQQLQLPITTCCSFTAEYLTNGHTYEFKVAATNASGNSPASGVASARPMPPFPEAPSGLSATPGDGRVSLRWNASTTSNVWYWIEYRSAGGTWTRTQYPVTTCCSFTMTYLMNGTTYEFRVRSTNLSGDSAPSTVASARPMPPFPLAPSGLTATPGDGQVSLQWNASGTSNVWYWIEYRPAGGTWTRTQYPVTTCCSFTMTYLTNTVTYEFRVRATNLSGDSAPSAPASARPMPPFPQAPPNLWYSKTSDTSATVSWSPSPTPRVYYYIYYRKEGGSYSRLAYPTLNTSISMPFEWGYVYDIYVTAINQAGESGSSPHVSIRIGPPDGTSRCATASGSFRNKLGSVPAAKFPYPTATICGHRDGHRINYTESWNTSGHKLEFGSFRYQIWDCDDGRLVHDNLSQSFPEGTSRTSWSGSDWTFITWTHTYKVRIVGGGSVNEMGMRSVQFSAGPDANPRFDAWSGCF